MSILWHPILAHLLSVVVDDYYRIETNVAVGDVPREADLVLLRRKDVKRVPFRRLWRNLTKWNILEYKSRHVSPRREDLPLLIELGLGITRRLNQQQLKEGLRLVPAGQVSFWYLANRIGKTYLRTAGKLLRDFQPIEQGIWHGEVVGHKIYLVSSVELPVDEETAPLSMLSSLSREKEHELAQLVWDAPKLRRAYRSWLWALHKQAYEEFRKMSLVSDEQEVLDLRPLIEHVGVREAIEQIGLPVVIDAIGVRKVVDEIGLKSVIDEIGLKSVVDEVGLKSVIDEVGAGRLLKEIGRDHLSELSPDERRELKQWLDEANPVRET